MTTKSTSPYRPGDATYGTVYLRGGLIRKKLSRGGYPLSITYKLSYWYAGETPGSLARATRRFARPTYATAVDALGIRYPAAGPGERGRMMFPAGE